MCRQCMSQHSILLGLALIAALCIGVGLGASPATAAEEVVLYSARHYGQEPAFDAFTKQTGISVKIFDGSPPELFERLQAEGDKTPADVLLSVDAGDLWNAAQAGLFARIDSPELQANIPAHLRDAETRWFGLTVAQVGGDIGLQLWGVDACEQPGLGGVPQVTGVYRQ